MEFSLYLIMIAYFDNICNHKIRIVFLKAFGKGGLNCRVGFVSLHPVCDCGQQFFLSGFWGIKK